MANNKNGINEKYLSGFIEQVNASQAGEVVVIPHPLDRVGKVYNIMPSRYHLIVGSTGSGKGLPLDEPVLTPKGWILNGKLKAGDYVIGSDMSPIKVLGVYPQGIKPVYTITFEDGTTTNCDEDHLWYVERKGNTPKVFSIKELLTKKLSKKYVDKRYNTTQTQLYYRVPLPKPSYKEPLNKHFIDAYTMGVLLGDGGFRGSSIQLSLNNNFDKSKLKFPEGISMNVILKTEEKTDYRLVTKLTSSNPLLNEIRRLGLSQHLSIEKFIPKEYLYSDNSSKRALLQGLLDSDGYISGKNSNEFSTSSDKLADGMKILLRSLGIYFTYSNRIPKYKYKGEVLEGSLNHRFFIRFSKTFKSIVSIKFKENVETSCIKVDALDSLYVTRDYTLTHNTSYADYCYILDPWSTMIRGGDSGIHWEVNYFSLERKQMFKHAKWVSWMIYRDNPEMLVSADQILGWDGGPMNDKGYQLVRSYDEEMSNLLDHVEIYDGKVNPEVIERTVKKRAYELGTFFHSDERGVKMNDQLVYMKEFHTDGVEEETRQGAVTFIHLEWKGKKFKLRQDDHRYFPDNPRNFVFFIIDGINLLGKKEIIDDISVVLANARDLYGFSPIVISQQNRAMGDITRMKIHGADLSPQIEDVFKSSQMGFDADLIIGLFDPMKYKSWDKEGKYGGYVINPMGSTSTPSMQTPGGINRFRSKHILKNTFGPDGLKIGMKFLGECNHFTTLPYPDDIEIEKIYSDIRRGL